MFSRSLLYRPRFARRRPSNALAALGFMALGAAIALAVRPAVERVRAARSSPDRIDDGLLVDRVRAALDRTVNGAATVDVRARDGLVVLKGPARPEQIEELVACAQRVEGVRGVDNRMSVYGA
ncbi:MAG TPA: BON domain-containing protein [Usitatibacter sp.]|jgi:osmotically-inducible protein OsmY|nr:BON domain-containing protein [Usitatibacter sp.]